MWHLVQYSQDSRYGLIEAPSLDATPTRLCRTSNGAFAVNSILTLTQIVPEERAFDWTLNQWLTEAKVNIIESFEADDPLTDLPSLFPEHYI